MHVRFRVPPSSVPHPKPAFRCNVLSVLSVFGVWVFPLHVGTPRSDKGEAGPWRGGNIPVGSVAMQPGLEPLYGRTELEREVQRHREPRQVVLGMGFIITKS